MEAAGISLGASDELEKHRKALTEKFNSMMKALFAQQGASLDISILTDEPAQDFITTHAAVLDSGFAEVKMSDAMRRKLQNSDYIFSGLKAFHELNEAFPSLIDENGVRKPFERFLNDVKSIDDTYNGNYLRAEYNFVCASGAMAARWEQFAEDGDEYNLQYRTAGDARVRPEHAKLNGITLPYSHRFWDDYYPPNGWNCRCTVVQVRKGKYEVTPEDEAFRRADESISAKEDMFRFNPGKEEKAVPDYNPYSIRQCKTCPIAKGTTELARNGVPNNDLCKACIELRGNAQNPETRVEWGKGVIYISKLLNPNDSDYNDLITVARSFAETGSIVHLPPKLSRYTSFEYKCVYPDLIGTKYEGKCPDLLIDGKRYEFESFITHKSKRALSAMLRRGLKQSDRLIIQKPDLTERFILHAIILRLKEGQIIKEVQTLDRNGKLEIIYPQKKAGE